jgi:hypothetical protein
VTPQGKSGDLKLMMGVMRGRYSSSLLSIFEEAVGLPFFVSKYGKEVFS